jgi:hypothetical protein
MNNSGVIPSENMAETVKALVNNENFDAEDMPEGFVFCGAGAHRTTILAPDGYVYKVQHDTDDMWMENQWEWETYHLFGAEVKTLSNGMIRLAKAVEFFTDSNVLVMEYAPMAANAIWYDVDDNDNWNEYYSCPTIRNAIRDIGKHTLIDDIHGYNLYYTTNAELVIVDYASAC